VAGVSINENKLFELNERAQVHHFIMTTRSVSILGTPISLLSMNRALSIIDMWQGDKTDRFVVFRDVHGVMLARDDLALKRAHQEAEIVAPDGMPIVWAARWAGGTGISRVCGPDLMLEVCRYGVTRGWRHFFYGGASGVAEVAVKNLRARFPGLIVAGIACPPFRPLTLEEDESMSASIRLAKPNFVWVGLGTPKQELWMAEHRGRLGGVTMMGVGAAFDIYAERISRAPIWMQKLGLEWAFRLFKEPRRLWKRYLILAPKFLVLITFDTLKHCFEGSYK
jgi:N-acetylglucosaminyldiphosphoundecaprenol N-acetyl-beta-D-mannosaminyltransferase